MAISGPKHHAQSYIEGKNVLANMRLCANVPPQHAIATALGGYQSIHELIVPGGGGHVDPQHLLGLGSVGRVDGCGHRLRRLLEGSHHVGAGAELLDRHLRAAGHVCPARKARMVATAGSRGICRRSRFM